VVLGGRRNRVGKEEKETEIDRKEIREAIKKLKNSSTRRGSEDS